MICMCQMKAKEIAILMNVPKGAAPMKLQEVAGCTGGRGHRLRCPTKRQLYEGPRSSETSTGVIYRTHARAVLDLYTIEGEDEDIFISESNTIRGHFI